MMRVDIGSAVEAHPVMAVAGAVGVGLLIYTRTGGDISSLLGGLKLPTSKQSALIGSDTTTPIPLESPGGGYASAEMLQNYYNQLQQQIQAERAALEQEIWRQQQQNYNGGPSMLPGGEGG